MKQNVITTVILCKHHGNCTEKNFHRYTKDKGKKLNDTTTKKSQREKAIEEKKEQKNYNKGKINS